MKRIAIIGSGIAGLSAAYHLKGQCKLHIYEQNKLIGGHCDTFSIEHNQQKIPIDTCFILYNEQNYPHFSRFLKDLNVRSTNNETSFGVHNQNTQLQYSTKSVNTLFAQRKNALSFQFYHFLLQMNRFFNDATQHLQTKQSEISLRTYLKLHNYDEFFIQNFILPMSAAAWCVPTQDVLDYPAKTLIRFYANHGFAGLDQNIAWKSVKGGSQQFLSKLESSLDFPVKTNLRVQNIAINAEQKAVITTQAGKEIFDAVLIAAHANQALSMLDTPSQEERELLGAYSYQPCNVVLHTDSHVMPPKKSTWSSWNYKIKFTKKAFKASTVFHLNTLQNLPKGCPDHFLSIDEIDSIDPQSILKTIQYQALVLNEKNIAAQKKILSLNDTGPIFYTGSYFRYGFHEDSLISSLYAVDRIKDYLLNKSSR